MPTVCIIQARMGSSRLPGKVMRPLAGREVLWHVWDRVHRCPAIDEIVFATTIEPADDRIEDYCRARNWHVTRGSETDVLSRYHEAASLCDADPVIRVTSDCPLIDPGILERLIREFATSGLDYMSTNYPERSFPHGCDCEIMTRQALDTAFEVATSAYDREHVTPFIYTNPERFRLGGIKDNPDRSHVRITLDTLEDYTLISNIYDRFYRDGEIVSLDDAVAFYKTDGV
jgi:spore coat polysaccharide biosynthesis protein SpsF